MMHGISKKDGTPTGVPSFRNRRIKIGFGWNSPAAAAAFAPGNGGVPKEERQAKPVALLLVREAGLEPARP